MKESSALADKGYAEGWFYLGWLHNKGLGVPENHSMAETCYKNAVERGNLEALISLGRLYKDNGSAKESFGCFLSAANSGYLPGVYWAGRAYLYGEGTEKDLVRAKKYLTLAADKGHVYARVEYCRAQIHGVYGWLQRIAGLFGLFKAIILGWRTIRSDPYGDRVR